MRSNVHENGIISACAERTSACGISGSSSGDHLRVCGADTFFPIISEVILGSSPRVRSGQTAVKGLVEIRGDHLRVCGADTMDPKKQLRTVGSSPRVRSGPERGDGAGVLGRIISACAERTPYFGFGAFSARDHLRVCGADELSEDEAGARVGSSPRVRSGQVPPQTNTDARGIISACAERTVDGRSQAAQGWDHLRVCGADRWCDALTM